MVQLLFLLMLHCFVVVAVSCFFTHAINLHDHFKQRVVQSLNSLLSRILNLNNCFLYYWKIPSTSISKRCVVFAVFPILMQNSSSFLSQTSTVFPFLAPVLVSHLKVSVPKEKCSFSCIVLH